MNIFRIRKNIAELAQAIRMLGWHVGSTLVDAEAKDEVRKIRNGMEKIQNSWDGVDDVGPWRCPRCETYLGMFARINAKENVLLLGPEGSSDYRIPHHNVEATCPNCGGKAVLSEDEWESVFGSTITAEKEAGE